MKKSLRDIRTQRCTALVENEIVKEALEFLEVYPRNYCKPLACVLNKIWRRFREPFQSEAQRVFVLQMVFCKIAAWLPDFKGATANKPEDQAWMERSSTSTSISSKRGRSETLGNRTTRYPRIRRRATNPVSLRHVFGVSTSRNSRQRQHQQSTRETLFCNMTQFEMSTKGLSSLFLQSQIAEHVETFAVQFNTLLASPANPTHNR